MAGRIVARVVVVLLAAVAGWSPADPARAGSTTTLTRPFLTSWAHCGHNGSVATCTAAADHGSGAVAVTAEIPETVSASDESAYATGTIDVAFTLTDRTRRVVFTAVLTQPDLGSTTTGNGHAEAELGFEASCPGCAVAPRPDGLVVTAANGGFVAPQTLRFRVVARAEAELARQYVMCVGTCSASGVSVPVFAPGQGSASAHSRVTVDRVHVTVD